VLIPVSQGYPVLEGRLCTRYSPVRHSCIFSKLKTLPFDLHVLSLPLAFILSQDQTLHSLFLIVVAQKTTTLNYYFKSFYLFLRKINFTLRFPFVSMNFFLPLTSQYAFVFFRKGSQRYYHF
jgi:hypothetical protein